MSAPPRATVVLLTFNGEEFLHELLTAVSTQDAPFSYEVLAIDSGSTDATLSILEAFPEVRVEQIPNAEFGHGRTRNLAVEQARGDIVVLLTQDAVPADTHWLAEFVAAFDDAGDQLGAVFGRQIPRADCCPTVKRDVQTFFSSFGPTDQLTLQRALPPEAPQSLRDAAGFLSNVNSAARRDVLKEIPFPDVAYAEDQAFGRAVIAAGYLKAYVPSAAVFHSHNLGPRDYFERQIDEWNGLRDSAGVTADVSRKKLALGWIKPTLADVRFIARDPAYSPTRKLAWVATAPLYNVGRLLAMRLAASDNPDRNLARFSREHRLKHDGR